MQTTHPRGVGATILFMIVPVAVGIPLVAYLWETVNQLLAGTVTAARIGISVPLLVVFALLLWWLARRVMAFDRSA